jgi:hypothetical protein
VKVVLCGIAVAARQRFFGSGDFARLRRERARPPASLQRIGRSSTRTWNPCRASTSAHASPHVLAPTTMALSSLRNKIRDP